MLEIHLESGNSSTGEYTWGRALHKGYAPTPSFKASEGNKGHTVVSIRTAKVPETVPDWIQKLLDTYEEFLKGWPDDLVQKVTITYTFS